MQSLQHAFASRLLHNRDQDREGVRRAAAGSSLKPSLSSRSRASSSSRPCNDINFPCRWYANRSSTAVVVLREAADRNHLLEMVLLMQVNQSSSYWLYFLKLHRETSE